MPLPVETLDHIVSYVEDLHDLRALCLTSSVLCPMTERYLYRDICLHSAKAILILHKVILRKPRLARFVLSMYVGPLERDRDPKIRFWRKVLMPGFIRLIFRLLRGLSRLRNLDFRHLLDAICDVPEPGITNLASCHFELDRLQLISGRPISLPVFDAYPTVKALKITSVIDADYRLVLDTLRDRPQTILPHLSELEVDIELAGALLPQRPVKNLVILEGPVEEEVLCKHLPSFGLSCGPLRRFSVEVYYLTPETLRRLFTSLRELTEFNVCVHDEPGTEVMAAFDETATDGTLRHLESLAELNIDVGYWSLLDREDHYTLNILRLGLACRSLGHVRLSSSAAGADEGSKVRVSYRRASAEAAEREITAQGWTREVEEHYTNLLHSDSDDVDHSGWA